MISADFIIEKGCFGSDLQNRETSNDETVSGREGNWKIRSFNGASEELFYDYMDVNWSVFSEESIKTPVISLKMESQVVSAHWMAFYLPEKYGDEFEVSLNPS